MKAMGGRGAVRSSARLSAETTQAPSTSNVPGTKVRPVAAAAAAAARRARAAERAREVEDSPRVLKEKCRRLARALRNAKHLVVSCISSTKLHLQNNQTSKSGLNYYNC